MSRPTKPENYRNLTPKEFISLTPRDRKLPMPPFDVLLSMLDNAVKFSTRERPETIDNLRIWWVYTTQFKMRENFINAWRHNHTFDQEYTNWKTHTLEQKNAKYYHFDEEPGKVYEDSPYAVDAE